MIYAIIAVVVLLLFFGFVYVLNKSRLNKLLIEERVKVDLFDTKIVDYYKRPRTDKYKEHFLHHYWLDYDLCKEYEPIKDFMSRYDDWANKYYSWINNEAHYPKCPDMYLPKIPQLSEEEIQKLRLKKAP